MGELNKMHQGGNYDFLKWRRGGGGMGELEDFLPQFSPVLPRPPNLMCILKLNNEIQT